MMKLCKVADALDWQDPEFQSTASLLKLNGKNRKAWEFIHVYNGLNQLGCLHEGARCLGLGVGREPLVYAFTNICKEVIATDLYNSQTWETASMDPNEVYGKNHFPYHRERLIVRNMDMTKIEFPDNSFDFIWSCCAIEHVNNFRELHKVYEEIHRVLKPGGIAALTTESNKTNQPLYEPNLLYTDQTWVEQWFTRPDPLVQGFELLDPPDFYITPVSENDPIPRREPIKLIQVYTKDIISSSIAFFLRKSSAFSKAYDETWLSPFWSAYLAACDRHRDGKFHESEVLLTQVLQDPILDPRLKVRATRRLLVALESQRKFQEMVQVCRGIVPDCKITEDQDQIMPIAHFCKRLNLWEDARELYAWVEQLQGCTIGQVIESLVGQAYYFEHHQHYTTALDLLERAKQLAIANGQRTKKSLYSIYFHLGSCNEPIGKLEAAETYYRLALAAAEPNSELYTQAYLRLQTCLMDRRFKLRSLWRQVKQMFRRGK